MVTQAEIATQGAGQVEEKRHFGAMLDLTRHFGGIVQMLVVSDTSKAEASAGIKSRFTRSDLKSWSVFAGGREDGETADKTLNREIPEETLELTAKYIPGAMAPELLAVMNAAILLPREYSSLFPFIVGQLKYENDRLTRINEVAAATVSVDYDALSVDMFAALRYLESKKLAKWVDIQKLVYLFRTANEGPGPQIDKVPVRPQILTMAMLHQMERIEKYDPNVIRAIALGWNMDMSGILHKIGERHHLPVNNGVFNKDGTIKSDLPAEDRDYLGLDK